MPEILLDEWSVHPDDADPFISPELRGIVLVGKALGHPKKPDGQRVVTSRVLRADGRKVYTQSGSVYRLNSPSAGYMAWLRENRPAWDPENPITVVKRNHG